MCFSGRKRFVRLSVLCLSFLFLQSAVGAFAQDKDWRPVTAPELAAKTPVVEPDADAEATFWEVRVDDSSPEELALRHYVRVKIFTERGREKFSKVDVPFMKGMRVKDVEARVTKPDGSMVLLKKEDVLEREIVRASGTKVKAKSFALPGLEIGSIIEYRYREVLANREANMRLIFQRDIPIQNMSYYVKPFSGTRDMKFFRFNVDNTLFVKDKNGFSRATMTNVPAFHEEPNMLPEDEVRSWMYIYYTSIDNSNPEEYWKNVSKIYYESAKNLLKANDEVKKATAEAVNGATGDDEKIRRIFDYTKTQIKNLSYTPTATEEEWKKVREAKTPGDTLKLRMGSAGDIDNLFGAMARAEGFDARLALSGDRSEMFFNPRYPDVRLMLNSSSIAIKSGDNWKFFSPSSYYTPFGMMNWIEENQMSLITDPKELLWVSTPLSTADKSMAKRTGKFKLLEDGTLEGEGRIEFTGHWANYHKSYNDEDSVAQRETTLKNYLKRTILSTAEVENISIENVTDPEKPFVYAFKIRVPGYAQKTGKRLFFQPNVYERSAAPRFTANARKYDVYITYPWMEQDDITLELPAGFSLENAESPATVKDGQGIGSHETQIMSTKDGRSVTYKRKFSFGNGGLIKFPVQSYPAVKSLFEAFHKADTHQLTIRQATASTN